MEELKDKFVNNGIPIMEKTDSDKLDYYWSSLYLACYNRDTLRAGQCYFAIKAIEKRLSQNYNEK